VEEAGEERCGAAVEKKTAAPLLADLIRILDEIV